MQYIELKEMTFHAYHGVIEQEKKVGNTFTIDLKMEFDFQAAQLSDDLNDTINYASVYEIVKQEMKIPSRLIEHAAGRIIRRLQNEFPLIEKIEIRLAKKNPPFGGDIKEAAVVIVADENVVFPNKNR